MLTRNILALFGAATMVTAYYYSDDDFELTRRDAEVEEAYQLIARAWGQKTAGKVADGIQAKLDASSRAKGRAHAANSPVVYGGTNIPANGAGGSNHQGRTGHNTASEYYGGDHKAHQPSWMNKLSRRDLYDLYLDEFDY